MLAARHDDDDDHYYLINRVINVLILSIINILISGSITGYNILGF